MQPLLATRSFLQRALFDTPQDTPRLSTRALTWARIVSVVALIAGGALLAIALHIRPGDGLFYPVTLGVAAVWAAAGIAGGGLRRGVAVSGRGRKISPAGQGAVLGIALLAIFLVGAVVVAQIPLLRGPVDGLLDHARFGALPAVLAVTVVTGLAEELFFRGTLYDAVPSRLAVPVTTLLYAVVTSVSGVPLLIFASLILGSVTALQRRATGGQLGPMITHIVWSAGMLLLLPPVLDYL
ncbi:CPBP family intramembrane metalloprotease [Epidermidibacterium keratini]|uniref:CPBP family intramembrane metalloprotease n=1 Tax=Epidermidibacterium keratini TaxID=1891644 RepID=A0A7L4YM95_9ACTN|nr:CPBP family intramembrane glutamic endopeptidase [Epidermidibacterium keratini]QHC00198.1 CPBP family intramembrane metalloprotease [Epidermidibacterium keratini]